MYIWTKCTNLGISKFFKYSTWDVTKSSGHQIWYPTCMRHQHKSVMFCWVPSHVGIQGNERVDVLAKLALIEAYTNIKIPYTDLVYYAKLHLRRNWDQQVQSKLHAVHPELGLWPHSSQERRRDELILCRHRIGHTHLTHQSVSLVRNVCTWSTS